MSSSHIYPEHFKQTRRVALRDLATVQIGSLWDLIEQFPGCAYIALSESQFGEFGLHNPFGVYSAFPLSAHPCLCNILIRMSPGYSHVALPCSHTWGSVDVLCPLGVLLCVYVSNYNLLVYRYEVIDITQSLSNFCRVMLSAVVWSEIGALESVPPVYSSLPETCLLS